MPRPALCARVLAGLLLLVLSFAAAADNFPRPDALKPAVAFWTRVYTEIPNHRGFVHDNTRLDVVYATISLPRKGSYRAQTRIIRRHLNHYRAILRVLGSGKRKQLNKGELAVLKAWGTNTPDKVFRAAAKRVRFQRGQANKFREGLRRSGAWEAHIKQTLRQLGAPTELAALPHVESSFNPYARSHVGAAGMWQFTRSTGRRFMRIDHVVDERLDPFKSTVAAAQLLLHNYSVLGHWPLALTAYNHGLAGMRRAVTRTGSTDMGVIARTYKGRLFGFASRNFYAAFLAALDVSRNPQKFFGKIPRRGPDGTPVRKLGAYVAAPRLARELGVPLGRLRALNAPLQRSVWRGDKYIPKGYPLRVPYRVARAHKRADIAAISRRIGYTAQKPDTIYRVRRGDSLSRIARRFRTSTRRLMAMNGLRSAHRIRVGQKLRLPGAKGPLPRPVAGASRAVVAEMRASPSTAKPRNQVSYRVRRGDSLGLIARRQGISLQRLLAYNNLTTRSTIRPGQVLRLRPRPQIGPVQPDKPILVAAAPKSRPATQAPATKPLIIATQQQPRAAAPSPHPAERPPVEAEEREAQADEKAAAEEKATSPPDPDSDAELAGTPGQLGQDPADYEVDGQGRILVQASETLGHYAEWLGLRASRLRRINGLSYGRHIVIGKRLKLDFSRVSSERFEQRRRSFHAQAQAEYFEQNQIVGEQLRRLARGDSLWSLAARANIPLWLLRQYNPDLNPNQVLAQGAQVRIPRVAVKERAPAAQAHAKPPLPHKDPTG